MLFVCANDAANGNDKYNTKTLKHQLLTLTFCYFFRWKFLRWTDEKSLLLTQTCASKQTKCDLINDTNDRHQRQNGFHVVRHLNQSIYERIYANAIELNRNELIMFVYAFLPVQNCLKISPHSIWKKWDVSLLFLLLSFFLFCSCCCCCCWYLFPLEMFNTRVVCLCSLMLLPILGRRSFSLGHFLLHFSVSRLLFQVAHEHSLSLAMYTNTISMLVGWVYSLLFDLQNFFLRCRRMKENSKLDESRECTGEWVRRSQRITAVDKK